jgi:hypothetical protein
VTEATYERRRRLGSPVILSGELMMRFVAGGCLGCGQIGSSTKAILIV